MTSGAIQYGVPWTDLKPVLLRIVCGGKNITGMFCSSHQALFLDDYIIQGRILAQLQQIRTLQKCFFTNSAPLDYTMLLKIIDL